MGGFFVAAWFHVSAIISMSTDTDSGIIALIVGSIVIMLISVGLFWIYHRRQARIRKT